MLKTCLKDCSGCGVCSATCPKKAIIMKENNEHFLEPCVDKTKCVGCNLCNRVCPIQNKSISENFNKCFLVQLINRKILLKCASGGAFYGIARQVIDSGGVVFGVASETPSKLSYRKIDNVKDLELLLGSKYYQCNISNADYNEIISESKKRLILVSGTPCQISAIKNIKNINKDNLLLLEILCQGVPNGFVVDKFYKKMESKFNKHIVAHQFRSKDKYVGKKYLNKYTFSDNSVMYLKGDSDPLSLTFRRQIFLRNSCYTCKYANENRVSDFTVGDFWEDTCNDEIKKELGVSVLLCNSEKAFNFFNDNVYFNKEIVDSSFALKNNVPYHKSVNKPFFRSFYYKLLLCGVDPYIVSCISCAKYYLKKILKRSK